MIASNGSIAFLPLVVYAWRELFAILQRRDDRVYYGCLVAAPHEAVYDGVPHDSTNEWHALLSEADSLEMLVPDGYEDDVALAKILQLREQLTRALPDFIVKFVSPAMYQDSPGLAHCRILGRADGDERAWIMFSHFGGNYFNRFFALAPDYHEP